MRAVLALLTVLMAAGCVALPHAILPAERGVAWTETTAAPWVARHAHCGFGSGPDHACESWTVLYRDGSVLHVTYGSGATEGMSGLSFVNASHEAHRDAVQAVWDVTGVSGDARIHAVHAQRLDHEERDAVLRVVENALRNVAELPAATFDCQDCGALTYWTLGAPRQLAGQQWGHPPPDNAAWRLLEEQMALLQNWVVA